MPTLYKLYNIYHSRKVMYLDSTIYLLTLRFSEIFFIIILVDIHREGKDAMSQMYNQPSLLKKRRQTKQARFVIMDTIAHIVFLITILCLIYIYQDYSIYRTYQAHKGMFFTSFHKKVKKTSLCLVQISTRLARFREVSTNFLLKD